MPFFWGENQYFYKKYFQLLQVKILKFIVIIYLVLNLMQHYSTYIYPVVYTYKSRQNYFGFSPQILTFLYSGIFWEMQVLLLQIYLSTVILRK